ncbi:hypothetical protein BV25DRAFT_1825443 [Artomyces pyxidatus]|uniref:Uncharacterized protein n=1 Tax=Artomyces pyxidatus TaxID=48021 RepID=A0ACB8T138_9AGAM|nr:hypothetical protein BV25DRAFT_1825443 [Artomyces pyxidatus]
MPKLHLKRTPAEQVEHDLRKARRAARRAARESRRHDRDSGSESGGPSSRKRRRPLYEPYDEDSDGVYGPPPPHPGSSHPNYEDIRAQVEEQRFREKMWDAFGDDERLDAVESRLNDYAHVPKRWRGPAASVGSAGDEDGDPVLMDEDEYAEWIRAGMWRKKNAAALAEEQRQKAAHAAAQAEGARRAKAKEDAKRQRRRERERRQESDAREAYDRRWAELLAPAAVNPGLLRFDEVPWPVSAQSPVTSAGQFTVDAISAFLFPESSGSGDELARKRKDRLRETMLRFHPDKFEGRVMRHIREEHQEAVREGVGVVVRAVTELMGG